MIKILLTFLLSILIVHAKDIDINIVPDFSTSNIQLLGTALKEHLRADANFIMDSASDAERLAKENRTLSNAYLQKRPLSDYDKAYITMLGNEYLAKKFVKELQNAIEISDTALKSYYLDNLKKYQQPAMLNVTTYQFTTFEDALRFYQACTMKNAAAIQAKATEGGVQMNDLQLNQQQLDPAIHKALGEHTSNFLTYPLYFQENYYLIYLNNLTAIDSHLPFEEVKEHIKQALWQQTYLKKRQEILDQYGKAK